MKIPMGVSELLAVHKGLAAMPHYKPDRTFMRGTTDGHVEIYETDELLQRRPAIEPMPDGMFRQLSSAEVWEFQQWARQNYIPGDPIKGIWHPLIRDECELMNAKAALPKTTPPSL